MKKGLSFIAFVLDRSGSMGAMVTEAIGGFNSFVEDQQKEPGEALFTLAQFDHEYERVFDGIDLKDVPKLDVKRYVPRGTTALRDAVGRTILDVGKKLEAMSEDERPEHVIFVVLTDGMENASKDFSPEKLREMVDHQENVYSWKFLFLGANMDSFSEAHQMGMPQAAAMNFAPDADSLGVAYAASSRAVSSFRKGVKSVNLCDVARSVDSSYDPSTGRVSSSSRRRSSSSSPKH